MALLPGRVRVLQSLSNLAACRTLVCRSRKAQAVADDTAAEARASSRPRTWAPGTPRSLAGLIGASIHKSYMGGGTNFKLKLFSGTCSRSCPVQLFFPDLGYRYTYHTSSANAVRVPGQEATHSRARLKGDWRQSVPKSSALNASQCLSWTANEEEKRPGGARFCRTHEALQVQNSRDGADDLSCLSYAGDWMLFARASGPGPRSADCCRTSAQSQRRSQ